MNKYEFAVIVSSKLEDEDRAKTIDKVKEYVTRFGGTVTEVEEWGKRKLAYLINKEAEGYYVLFEFESTAEFPAELDRKFRINEDVIRSMIIKKEDE